MLHIQNLQNIGAQGFKHSCCHHPSFPPILVLWPPWLSITFVVYKHNLQSRHETPNKYTAKYNTFCTQERRHYRNLEGHVPQLFKSVGDMGYKNWNQWMQHNSEITCTGQPIRLMCEQNHSTTDDQWRSRLELLEYCLHAKGDHFHHLMWRLVLFKLSDIITRKIHWSLSVTNSSDSDGKSPDTTCLISRQCQDSIFTVLVLGVIVLVLVSVLTVQVTWWLTRHIIPRSLPYSGCDHPDA